MLLVTLVYLSYLWGVRQGAVLRGSYKASAEDNLRLWYIPLWGYTSGCAVFDSSADFSGMYVFDTPLLMMFDKCDCTTSVRKVPKTVRAKAGYGPDYKFPDLNPEKRRCSDFTKVSSYVCSVLHEAPTGKSVLNSKAGAFVYPTASRFNLDDELNIVVNNAQNKVLRLRKCRVASVLEVTDTCSSTTDALLLECDHYSKYREKHAVIVFGETVTIDPFDVKRNAVPLTDDQGTFVTLPANESAQPTVMTTNAFVSLESDPYEVIPDRGIFFREKGILMTNSTPLQTIVAKATVSTERSKRKKRSSVETLYKETEQLRTEANRLTKELEIESRKLLVGLFSELNFNVENLLFDSTLVGLQQFWDLSAYTDLRFLKTSSYFETAKSQLDNLEVRMRNVYLTVLSTVESTETGNLTSTVGKLDVYLLSAELNNTTNGKDCFAAPFYVFSDGVVKKPEAVPCKDFLGYIVSNSTHSFAIEENMEDFVVFENYYTQGQSKVLDDRLKGIQLQSRAAGQGPRAVFEIVSTLDMLLRTGQISAYKPHVKWVSGWDKFIEAAEDAVDFIADVGKNIGRFFDSETWITGIVTVVPFLLGLLVCGAMLKKAFNEKVGLNQFLKISIVYGFSTSLLVFSIVFISILRNFLKLTEKCQKISDLKNYV